jgi:hypothetical protein
VSSKRPKAEDSDWERQVVSLISLMGNLAKRLPGMLEVVETSLTQTSKVTGGTFNSLSDEVVGAAAGKEALCDGIAECMNFGGHGTDALSLGFPYEGGPVGFVGNAESARAPRTLPGA